MSQYNQQLQNSKYNPEQAKKVARNILNRYDKNRTGSLKVSDVYGIFDDVYKNVRTQFRPSNYDCEQFYDLLDYDQNRVVTLQDLENICIKHLCPQFLPKQQQYTNYGSNTNQNVQYQQNQYRNDNQNNNKSQDISPSKRDPQHLKGFLNQGIIDIINRNLEQQEDIEEAKPDWDKFPKDKFYGHSVFNTKNLFGDKSNLQNIDDKIVQSVIEKSKLKKIYHRPGLQYEKILNQYRGQKFTDQEFPPSIESLSQTKRWFDGGNIPYQDWKRASEHFNNQQLLFADGILPGDIQQGQLGDCYLQCALSAMAEWPERIQKLFTTEKANSEGVYGIWVVWDGVLKEVIVDDYLWYNNRNRDLVSMRAQGNELWPQLLEKTWAKLNGDYCSIDGGFARDPLHHFTGAPVIHFRIKEQRLWNEWKEVLWTQCLKGEDEHFIMTAGTYAEDPSGQQLGDTYERDGIFYCHAYTLLGAYLVTLKTGQQVKLLRFRNPHGQGEWKGKYSDNDNQSWSQVPQSEKDRIQFVKANDGVFFMEYENLRTYFEDVQICYYRDQNEYQGQNVKGQVGECTRYFKVDINQPGHYHFMVNQIAKSYIDQKLAVKGKGSNYRYQTASVICASQNGSIVSAARGRQKNISSYKVSLESKKIQQTGTYYVQASLNMDGQQYQNGVNSYGFGIYGPENGFKLQEVSLQQIPRQVQSSLQQCRHVENLPSYVI